MFEQYTLTNKANIILVPQIDTKSVTTLVMYPVGSRYETEKMRGVSHYIEHLMFKGTKKRPTTLALTREIDRLGAEYNAFTGKEYTGYFIKVDATYAETAIDILSDMLFHSLFDAKEMEKEKTVIVEEIRMYKDNPIMHIEDLFEESLFAGSRMGWNIAGTEAHVLSYGRDDVLAYRHRYYQPGNATIIIAGAIDDDIRKLLTRYFGKERNTRAAPKTFAAHGFGSSEKKDRIVVERKHTDQAQLMIGFPAFRHIDKRNTAGAVMNMILGGSMSSRLFIQIRERRGLAYMVKSGGESFRDAGYFYVRAGLDAKNMNEALKIIHNEIEKVKEKGVTQQELKDAKTHIRGSLTLSLEDSSAQADWYARQALFMDSIKTPEQKLREIERVTNEQIRDIARRVFHSNEMRLAVIGDIDPTNISF